MATRDCSRKRLAPRTGERGGTSRECFYSCKGTWIETSTTGQTVNALISADGKTDIMDGACYNDTFVDIESV